MPQARETALSSLIETEPNGVAWHTPAETQYLLELMTDLNRRKVDAAKLLGTMVIGTIYRRTRPDASGVKRQRAEVRFDEIAVETRIVQAKIEARRKLAIVNGM